MIARRAGFGQFQGRHDREQRGAGLESIQRAVTGQHAERRQQRSAEARELRRQRPAALRGGEAPGDRARDRGADPAGQVADVWHERERERAAGGAEARDRRGQFHVGPPANP